MKNWWNRAGAALLAACALWLGPWPVQAQTEGAALQALKKSLSGPQPSWVNPIQAPPAKPQGAEQVRQGVHYLLSDVQARVDGRQVQVFRHLAMKALNEKGVESIANIEIRFDPSYERLALHGITVLREGRRIERLASVDLRVIQREKELDYLIFDGSKSVHAFLDDVRVGDVVEYAYTISGSNPVFGERFFGAFDLQWSSPVARVQARLLWPAGRPLHLKAQNGGPEVEKRLLGEQEEYVWRQEEQPGLRLSPDAPAWYDPFAQVQWGDFGRWADVVSWALPLYRVPDSLSPALQAEVRRIAALGQDPKLRTAEALRLVQREVRYLGVEVGAGLHAPNAPDLVFKRRFGDCKDKTLLTLTLLKALGVPARAALVHTQARQSLALALPRPGVFNHVIVRAEIDGHPYWLDPTRGTQPGPLDDIGQSNYALALVVDPATVALSPIESSGAMLNKRQVTVRIDASGGTGQAARMTVTTELEGLSAEQLRAGLAAENASELQQRYLNFYARSYPGISLDQAFDVQDAQPVANRIRMVEHYQLTDFFVRVESRKRLEASLEVPEVLGLLQTPQEAIRNAPLVLAHPQELKHELELLLPEKWSFKDETEEVQAGVFSLRREVRGGDRRLHISDHFRSLADHVLPDDTAAYAANIEKARKMLGYVVYADEEGAPGLAGQASGSQADQLNLPVLVLALLLLGMFVRMALRWYRWDPPPIGAPAGADEPLGGLLILLALGLLYNGAMAAHGAWGSLSTYGLQTWNLFTVQGGARYHPLMAPVLLIEMAAVLAQLVGWCLVVLVFFKRRSGAVRIYLVYMWATVGFALLDQLVLAQIPVLADTEAGKGIGESIRAAAILALWTAYLLKSERVGRTFVRRLGGGSAAPVGTSHEEGGSARPAVSPDSLALAVQSPAATGAAATAPTTGQDSR